MGHEVTNRIRSIVQKHEVDSDFPASLCSLVLCGKEFLEEAYMKLTIKNIRARAVLVPLKRPPLSASGSIPEAAMVLVDIETGEGITGHAYLFAFSKAMLKPLVVTLEAVAEMIKGD